VRVEGAPLARARSGSTGGSEDLVAFLATKTDKTTITRGSRVHWDSVGRIGERIVAAEKIVWGAPGKDAATLDKSFTELGGRPRSRTERITVKGKNPILSVSEVPPAPARATAPSIGSSSTRSRRYWRAVTVDRSAPRKSSSASPTTSPCDADQCAVPLRDDQRCLEAVALPNGALMRPRERGDRGVSFEPQSGGRCAATWSGYREVRRRSTAGEPASSAPVHEATASPSSRRSRSARVGDRRERRRTARRARGGAHEGDVVQPDLARPLLVVVVTAEQQAEVPVTASRVERACCSFVWSNAYRSVSTPWAIRSANSRGEWVEAPTCQWRYCETWERP